METHDDPDQSSSNTKTVKTTSTVENDIFVLDSDPLESRFAIKKSQLIKLIKDGPKFSGCNLYNHFAQ